METSKNMMLLKTIYQVSMRMLHGIFAWPRGSCRFSPTCSEYVWASFQSMPPHKALAKSIWRLLRCNPFSRGGYDPAE